MMYGIGLLDDSSIIGGKKSPIEMPATRRPNNNQIMSLKSRIQYYYVKDSLKMLSKHNTNNLSCGSAIKDGVSMYACYLYIHSSETTHINLLSVQLFAPTPRIALHIQFQTDNIMEPIRG